MIAAKNISRSVPQDPILFGPFCLISDNLQLNYSVPLETNLFELERNWWLIVFIRPSFYQLLTHIFLYGCNLFQ